MEKARIGIIGTGQIGKRHIERYADIEGVEIVAIADADEKEVARVAEKHGIAKTYTDFRELLKRDDIEAVDVCLHNNLHSPVTIESLRAGKHVYCEKPIAGTYADGKAMAEEAKAQGKMLHIQLAQLYSMETKAAKKLITEGALGKLYHARVVGFRRRGRPFVDGYATANFVKKEVAAGGALIDLGGYQISQMLYLLGLPAVSRVSGKIYQETSMDEERRKSSGYNVEEFATGFVRCKTGLTIDILEAWAAHMGAYQGGSILGATGGIQLDPFSYHTTFCDLEMNSTFELGAVNTRWNRTHPNEDAYESSQHHWIAVLQGRVELLPTAQLALNTALISEGIYLSDREDREVTVDEVEEKSISTAVKL